MVHSIKVAAAVGVAVLGILRGSAGAQIDLTPKEASYEVEGIKIPNVNFRNGSKPIVYTPPPNWTLTGGGNKVTLMPLDSVQAGATIETQTSREPLPPATVENAKVYSEMAAALAPTGATKIEVVEAIVCPMRISGKAMMDVTLTYTFFGQTFRMNVLFMPRDREQIRFQFAARTADFPGLFKMFRSSLFSMQGL